MENVFRMLHGAIRLGNGFDLLLDSSTASIRPDDVYAFGRRMQKLRIYACEGAEQLGKAIVQRNRSSAEFARR